MAFHWGRAATTTRPDANRTAVASIAEPVGMPQPRMASLPAASAMTADRSRPSGRNASRTRRPTARRRIVASVRPMAHVRKSVSSMEGGAIGRADTRCSDNANGSNLNQTPNQIEELQEVPRGQVVAVYALPCGPPHLGGTFGVTKQLADRAAERIQVGRIPHQEPGL